MKILTSNVSFGYPGQTEIFQGLTWRVASGESWAVLGPSGCGKTTLLYLLAGLIQVNEGEIRIDGILLQRPRPKTGLILQEYGLLPWASIRENVRLGLKIRQFYGPDGTHAPEEELPHRDVDDWLSRLGIAGLADQYPHQVSGGERQRTAIARTLVLNPDLLLMDEPFASLDAPTRRDLQNLILEIKKDHDLTLVTVTHTVEEAAVLGGNILLLGDPPHQDLQIIENPRGGAPGFRGCEEYYQLCGEINRRLDREVGG